MEVVWEFSSSFHELTAVRCWIKIPMRTRAKMYKRWFSQAPMCRLPLHVTTFYALVENIKEWRGKGKRSAICLVLEQRDGLFAYLCSVSLGGAARTFVRVKE